MFSSDALWRCGGQAGREPRSRRCRQARHSIRHRITPPGCNENSQGLAESRPVFEAGLLAHGGEVADAVVTPIALITPSRSRSGCAMNMTVYSCGGSCGMYRIPFLAPVSGNPSRRTSSAQGYAVVRRRSTSNGIRGAFCTSQFVVTGPSRWKSKSIGGREACRSGVREIDV